MYLWSGLSGADDETFLPHVAPRQPNLRRQPVRFWQGYVDRFSGQNETVANIANERARRQDDVEPAMA
nr:MULTISPECIES: hypothetical protein [unclassified Roseobacter]